jgi:D-amino-acid oxidase
MAINFMLYASIAQKRHKDFKDGAIIVPAYFTNREDSGLEPYVGKVMTPAKDIIIDFGNCTKRNMICYDDGIFIDTEKMMIGLREYLEKKKIKFVEKKVHSFAELKENFIINCTGLGSSELNRDVKMSSVQGHLIMLKDQNPKELQYMLLVYFNEGKTKSGQTVKRSFYIFPKHSQNTEYNDVGVIGGTFIEGATSQTPNEEEFDILLQGAKKFYGIK